MIPDPHQEGLSYGLHVSLGLGFSGILVVGQHNLLSDCWMVHSGVPGWPGHGVGVYASWAGTRCTSVSLRIISLRRNGRDPDV